jgi:peptidoglycan/LPS O-acetylase OafA/YrhL
LNNDKTIYFAGLNGLRMISALAVVISHITLSLGDFGLDSFIFGKLDDGQAKGLSLAGYGVSIFFVISGFLITYLLQAEKQNGTIDIKKFYVRRILRIWPLYYLYLIVAVITIIATGLYLDKGKLLLYIFFAANVPFILGSGMPFLTHYWSLGVEEQFYLFWPWLNRKPARLEGVILSLIITLGGLKLFFHFFRPGSVMEEIIHVTRFHCMMIGALGALLYKRRYSLFMKIANHKISQAICWLILLLVAINKYHVASVIDNEIISVVALIIIIGQINSKNRIVNLENNVFDFLGKISYGMYVIHPLLIFLISRIAGKMQLHPWIKYPLVYLFITGLTILIAWASYEFYEKRFLRLKKKFEVVKTCASRIES